MGVPCCCSCSFIALGFAWRRLLLARAADVAQESSAELLLCIADCRWLLAGVTNWTYPVAVCLSPRYCFLIIRAANSALLWLVASRSALSLMSSREGVLVSGFFGGARIHGVHKCCSPTCTAIQRRRRVGRGLQPRPRVQISAAGSQPHKLRL